MIIELDVLLRPVADHEVIVVSLNIRKPKRLPVFKTYCSLKKYPQVTLCNLLMNEVGNLNCIIITDDVNRQVNILDNAMNVCADNCAPIVTTCREY